MRLVPSGRRWYRSRWLEDALYPRHAGERVRLTRIIFGLGILHREEGYEAAAHETFDLEETHVSQLDGSGSLFRRIVWSVSVRCIRAVIREDDNLNSSTDSAVVWMSLYWRSYEERPVIQATLRFLPLCVVGVFANIVGSFCVAYVVRDESADCYLRSFD